jgi:hypothetical protein
MKGHNYKENVLVPTVLRGNALPATLLRRITPDAYSAHRVGATKRTRRGSVRSSCVPTEDRGNEGGNHEMLLRTRMIRKNAIQPLSIP